MRFVVAESGKLSAPGGTWVRVEDDALPRPVYVRVAESGGRLICTGLAIDSDPERELTARDLRRIPLAAIMTALTRPRKSPALQALLERTTAQRARPGRRGHPDHHYRQVARAYRQAKRKHPRAPIRALMDELHASEPTVHRWLRTAREKGFLEPTKKGRGGAPAREEED